MDKRAYLLTQAVYLKRDGELIMELRLCYQEMAGLYNELGEASLARSRYFWLGEDAQTELMRFQCDEIHSRIMEVRLNIDDLKSQRTELKRIDDENKEKQLVW